MTADVRWHARRPADWLAPGGTWPAGPFRGGVPWEVIGSAELVLALERHCRELALGVPELALRAGVALEVLREVLGGCAVPSPEFAVAAGQALGEGLWPSSDAVEMWRVCRPQISGR